MADLRITLSGSLVYRGNQLMLILTKRLAFGAAIGALPGGLLVSSTLIFRGEIALSLGAWGVIMAAFGAIAGLLIGLGNCVPKLK